MTTFGQYAAIGDPPRGEHLPQRIDEVCAEAQLAEQVGFDAMLVGEHHQHRDGFLPSPLIVSTAVAATRQQEEDEYGPEVLTAYKYYWQSNSLSFQEQRSEAEFSIATMAPDRIILGSPEEVVDQLQQWQEATGAEMVIFRLRQAHSGGPSHEKILRAIRLFGDKVIPKLR
jgi:alkanesulfonate monooxygenase SsuD/methylene tetrahydromethanopterin reductase-like flavin-dependent oxidoreductase (luciferase family)